jgi:hypothetical protein
MAPGPQQLAEACEAPAGVSATDRLMERGLLAIIAILIVLGLHRAFIANINWDEFYYLANVHSFKNGQLSLQLMTFHVHFFSWLPFVSDNEVGQVIAARSVLWLLSLASCWLIYRIARLFCSRLAALLSVLFYLGFSYVVDHGLTFRMDPICAFLFLASLYFLLTVEKSRYHVPLSALFMAVAMIVSVKSLFYLGTIGVIFLARLLFESNGRAAVKDMLLFAAVFLGAFVALFQIHTLALANDNLTDPVAYLRSAGNKAMFSSPFLPRINYILRGFLENGIIWVFIGFGLAKAVHDAIKGPKRKQALTLVALAAPLLSLLVYFGAYPYFYVFLMPAAVILGGVFADVLMARARASQSKILLLILGGTVLFIPASTLGDYIRKLPNQTVAQMETVALVHRMFPEPVPYIDRNSMISSFPKAGMFMSTWRMELYRAAGKPVMEDVIRRGQPKFLIANSCRLDIFEPKVGNETPCDNRLLREDSEILRTNFVHHWGAIYVAGKSFDLQGPSDPQDFEILIAGDYTLEAEAAVALDGVIYRPGDQVHLDRGAHTIASTGAPRQVVLRWGANLYRPSHEPSLQPIFYGF